MGARGGFIIMIYQLFAGGGEFPAGDDFLLLSGAPFLLLNLTNFLLLGM